MVEREKSLVHSIDGRRTKQTAKSPQMAVRRNIRTKTLKRCNASKDNGRCAVDKINGSHNGLSPKMPRNRSRKKKGTSSL